jgi:outer membrane protein OmpA-like peptidoglycan-associated protein
LKKNKLKQSKDITMKKLILITALIATTSISSQPVFAEASKKSSSKEENIGFAAGALTGAAAGGPIGLIIGATLGAIFGNEVKKADSFEQALVQSKVEQKQLQLALQVEQSQHQQLQAQQAINGSQSNFEDVSWVTGGLNLNLLFTTNSADLSDSDLINIEQVAFMLSQHPQLNLELDGYADPRGNSADNLKLSQMRIDSVKQAFIELGIDDNRILTTAHGEMQGLDSHDNSLIVDIDSYALARKVSVNFANQSQSQLAQN